jgi:hypothetical protein
VGRKEVTSGDMIDLSSSLQGTIVGRKERLRRLKTGQLNWFARDYSGKEGHNKPPKCAFAGDYSEKEGDGLFLKVKGV